MINKTFLNKLDPDGMRIILESIPDGLLITDENGSAVYANQAAKDILQLKEPCSSLQTILKQKLFFDPLSFNENVRKESLISNTSYSIFITPLFDNEVKKGVSIFLRDASMLQDAEEIKTDFVSIASHELLTPLTSIRNSLEILLKLNTEFNDPRQDKFLNIAFRNVNRMSVLVDQYLDITKIETGRLQCEFNKLNLGDLLDSMAEEFREKANNKGLSFFVNMPPGLPDILADSQKLEQIFFNLVGNALKFTDTKGSITISAEQISPHAKDNSQKSRPMIRVSVADTGVGIPEDKRTVIFNKFSRAGKSLEMGKEGVGLGLAIVKKLVELHGGEIHAEANEPTGSRFCFTLPIYEIEKRDPGFRWIFDLEFQRNRKNGKVLSLMAILLENFQSVQTRIGEEQTDIILKKLEATIKKSLYRHDDIVIHRKEDEMFVLFCEAKKDGARAICKRLKKNIVKFLEAQSEGLSRELIIHVGFSTYPYDADNQRDLFRKAFSNAREG
jgi:diguanylate cyclase (GGDEF)-like protein